MMVGALHRMWAALPKGLRHHPALRSATSKAKCLLASRAVAGRSPRPGPVTICGLLQSASGLGQGARLSLQAFGALGCVTRQIDLSDLFGHADLALPLGSPARPGEGGTVMLHLNPPELPLALPALGRRLLRDRRIIGNWAWELPGIPPAWRSGFRYVDEVWVHSRFAAGAIAPHTERPVRVVPLPVAPPRPAALSRADFGLPEGAFVGLVAFDHWSSLARKNPLGALRAFRLAFGEGSAAVLALKINERPVAPEVLAPLERELAGMANVQVIRRRLPQEELAALIRCADAVISLHRAEGFGLVLAEAMRLGKPVVATGWSGNTDFMNEGNSALVGYRLVPVRDPQGIYVADDQLWAEPDIEQAARWLRRLASEEGLARRIGDAARRDADEFFSLDRFRDNIGGTERFATAGSPDSGVGAR